MKLTSQEVAQLELFYDASSKHGTYHPIPEFLRGYLSEKGVDEHWRSPKPRIELLKQELGSKAGTVFELGCNTGYQLLELAHHFKEKEVIGVELNDRHAEFARLCIQYSGLKNCHVLNETSSPRRISANNKGSVILDFNVAHHAGSDFGDKGTSESSWWEDFLKDWFPSPSHGCEHWFSSGFRLGGIRGRELHPVDDARGFIEKVLDRAPGEAQCEIYYPELKSETIVYSRLDLGDSSLEERQEKLRSSKTFYGEYFRRPLFRFFYF